MNLRFYLFVSGVNLGGAKMRSEGGTIVTARFLCVIPGV